ncbi:hypothetical protein H8B09_07350 [Paenibacillus sp. PR3]|uniref:Prenylated flavin chaperone LpdD-like domain-containing protein n=1 Tax=Paenibacillus terricola TaxID=2763503 RepID=A0ABR8MU92_9BACL|nr:hypothetical protein [Paenibacillus terricola]MBD3918562.1 hypothetical protein [Paenibacillus terricola]
MNNGDNGHTCEDVIQIRALAMGQDWVFLVSGGTAHIGAVAAAYRSDDQPIPCEVVTVPGHREGKLAVELATLASHRLRRTVSVVAGIHLHQPSKQQIEAVVELARSKLNQMLEHVESLDEGENAHA